MIKVKKVNPYLVDEYDVEMVYQAVLHYRDSLEKFKSWMSAEEVECAACGGQGALKNIEEEIEEYRKISMDIYMKCFNNHVSERVERPNKDANF